MNLTSNQLGNLGEARAIVDFVSCGFDVYTQFSGNNPFDFIVYRNNNLWIVEVRTTTKVSKNNSYEFSLVGTAYGPDRTVIHKPLNKNIDILACYVQPLDTICYVNAKNMELVKAIRFRETKSAVGSYRQRIISDYVNLEDSL